MRWKQLFAVSLALGAQAQGQEIVKVPASQAPTVTKPEDLFKLPPGQWYYARQLWQGAEPCRHDQCEAGYTSGDLVVSIEHAKTSVRIMAGLRNCSGVAYSTLETGEQPGKSMQKKVAKQAERVVKGLGKTCGATQPSMAPLDTVRLFPAKAAARPASVAKPVPAVPSTPTAQSPPAAKP